MTAKYHGPRCPVIHHGLMQREREDRGPGSEWVCVECGRRLYLDDAGGRVSAGDAPSKYKPRPRRST